jgi:hypothetical protein
LADATLKHFPTLREWLTSRPLMALEHAGDWERILAILAWFRHHPRAGFYLRQLDIPGVDSKFIETRKGLLSELLDRVLPPEAVDTQFAGFHCFGQRYGLASKPPLVRFRLLDERLSLQGLSDITVPAVDFARHAIAVKRVFVTENEINGLDFPRVPESLVIFGLGYDVDRIAEAEWLKAKLLYYWGDIDTHGFAILDRLHVYFPHARSFLMDRETLVAHRELWVRENDRHERSLGRLTTSEQKLFEDLKCDRLGERVRLEQERISFGWLQQALGALPIA